MERFIRLLIQSIIMNSIQDARNQKLEKDVYITRMGYSGLLFTNGRKQFEKFHIIWKVAVEMI